LSVNDELKNIYQVEHLRDQSMLNSLFNFLSGLIAYTCQQDKKASLDIHPKGSVGLSQRD